MARKVSVRLGKDQLIAEEARRNLPVAHYLFMLDMAARTGLMPILDDRGKPTGVNQELNTLQRIDIAKYLINKVLPEVPKEVYHVVSPTEANAIPLTKISHASSDALRALVAGAQITDASYTTPDE